MERIFCPIPWHIVTSHLILTKLVAQSTLYHVHV